MRGVNAWEHEGILVGSGAGLTLVVLLVLQSSTGSGLFGTKTVTSTVTMTTLLPTEDYGQVASAYANHLSVLSPGTYRRS